MSRVQLGVIGKEGSKKRLQNHESSILHDNVDHLLAKLYTELESGPGKNQSLHMLVWSAYLNFSFCFWL